MISKLNCSNSSLGLNIGHGNQHCRESDLEFLQRQADGKPVLSLGGKVSLVNIWVFPQRWNIIVPEEEGK